MDVVFGTSRKVRISKNEPIESIQQRLTASSGDIAYFGSHSVYYVMDRGDR